MINFSKVKFLSYSINSITPTYGDNGPLEIKHVRKISSGDTSNNSELFFSAHTGTHIDAPYHFYDKGKKINDYSADFWIFQKPFLINYEAKPGEIILLDSILKDLNSMPKNCDCLLINTGFHKYRKDKDTYIFHNPGIAPEVGKWLRLETQVRIIGFDFISLSSYEHRELGRIAHLAFLEKFQNNGEDHDPILIIEDMNLFDVHESPDMVIVNPLRYENADGCPVTVMAFNE